MAETTPTAAPSPASVLAETVAVPAFFKKLAAANDLPTDLTAEQALLYRQLGDRVYDVVKMAYDTLYAPYAIVKEAAEAAGLGITVPAPATPAVDDVAAFLDLPGVKAAADALALAK